MYGEQGDLVPRKRNDGRKAKLHRAETGTVTLFYVPEYFI